MLKLCRKLQGEDVTELEHYENEVFKYEGSPNQKKMIKFEKELTSMIDSLGEHFPSVDPFNVSVFRFYTMLSKLKNAKTQAKKR